MAKSILVAGGGGFIGSHLCEKLLEKGHHVTAVDNWITGRKDNTTKILENQAFKLVVGNVCDLSLIEQIRSSHFDEIYHLASPASVTFITEHPVEAAMANSLGTKNLLDIALDQKAKLLFASSSEAYGDAKEHPQKETYWGNVNPVGIRSGYDEGKRFGESLCMAYLREKNVDVKIIRIFNTYGPHSNPNDSRVVPNFITEALANKPITVHGDGKQTRSFCYVVDLVEGLMAMMDSKHNGPVNLGNPQEYTILEVAQKIIQVTNSKSEINFVARPIDDPQVRKPDITLANEILNWYPTVGFDEGIVLTINYFKQL